MRHLFTVLCLIGICFAQSPNEQWQSQFVNRLVAQHHFSRQQITQQLAAAPLNPQVLDKITHPAESKPWSFYRDFFITEDRIAEGVDYWKAHQQQLTEAAKRYQVSPAIIVAILGVETRYGTRKGSYPTLSALKTLAFAYPPRHQFFESELAQFFLLTRASHFDPLTIKGSYAGALGIPQFMPSSYRRFAINPNKTQPSDLFNSHRDAIFSIANYLHHARWQLNQPIAIAAITPDKESSWRRLLSKSAYPKYSIGWLRSQGIKPAHQVKKSFKAAVIDLQGTGNNEYWLTFNNFKAIMSYNPRIHYAMAVYQLSQAIKNRYEQR